MMPKVIKFSHDYEKLPIPWEGTQATLIGVWYASLDRLRLSHPSLIERDVKFRGEDGSYEFNFNDAIILTFYHLNTGTIFTTIRRLTDSKAKYYHDAIGESFVLGRIALIE